MKGEILTLCGSPLDGLVQVEDRGPRKKTGRRELVVHVLAGMKGGNRWNPLPESCARFDATRTGPDGLLWPTWLIPADRLHHDLLADRAIEPDHTRPQPPGNEESAPFMITEQVIGPQKHQRRRHDDPGAFAWAVLDSLQFVTAARADPERSRGIRMATVVVDLIAVQSAGLLRDVHGNLWTGCRPK